MFNMDSKKSRILFILMAVLGGLLIIFFGMRSFRSFRKFDGHHPRPPFAGELETDVEQIEDWMTVPFISHTYGVPPEVIFDSLNIQVDENGKKGLSQLKNNGKKSLKELNDEFFPGKDGYVLETVKAVILAHQATMTTGAPPPPPPPPFPPGTQSPPTSP